MPKRKIDGYIGKVFNKLTIIGDAGVKNGRRYVLCQCSCEDKTIREFKLKYLKNGDTKSCGCLQKDNALKNRDSVVSNKYGEWTVLEEVEPDKYYNRKVLARCSCVLQTEKIVALWDLKLGISTSCGCFRKEKLREIKTKHGYARHQLYHILCGMKDRCYNKNASNYQNYGERGVYICEEWLSNPKIFIEWGFNNKWEDGLEIDRINNDGPYAPWNCRFVTKQINIENKGLLTKSNTSGYRGVSWLKRDNTYVCYVMHLRKTMFQKQGFSTAKEAAIARDIFCIKNSIPLPLNFPELLYNQAV